MSEDFTRPNILFIIDDQHRYDYVGCAGASFLATPNLDRVAAHGIHFSQVTTGSPLCAPARIGLASGQSPCRLGALDNRAFYPLSVPTFYQRLRNHGYQVGMVGKHDLAKPDHLHGPKGDRPFNYALGFTQPHETVGKMEASSPSGPRDPYSYHLAEIGMLECFRDDYQARAASGWIVGASHDSVLPCSDYHDAYIGRVATEWLETVSDEFPWFYHVGFIGPHDPFDPPTEYGEIYRKAVMPEPIVSSVEGKPHWQSTRRLSIDSEEIAQTRRQYCASITLIDHYVGAMLDVLERRGLLENTYIVFTSDHGEMLGDHSMYTKQVPYEASVRIPLTMAGPGIAQGLSSSALIELSDLNPTVCELAGLPQQENLDAKSFCDVLRHPSASHRDATLSALRNWRMIRTERYKFVENFNDVAELYDLREDPGETNNIASEHPGLVKDLTKQIVRRLAEDRWLR